MGMAKTTSDSILGVIRKESWILDHFEIFVNIALYAWRRFALSECFSSLFCMLSVTASHFHKMICINLTCRLERYNRLLLSSNFKYVNIFGLLYVNKKSLYVLSRSAFFSQAKQIW